LRYAWQEILSASPWDRNKDFVLVSRNRRRSRRRARLLDFEDEDEDDDEHDLPGDQR